MAGMATIMPTTAAMSPENSKATKNGNPHWAAEWAKATPPMAAKPAWARET